MFKMCPFLIHVMVRNGCPERALRPQADILKQPFRLRGVHIFVNRSLHRNRMMILMLCFLVVRAATQSRHSNGRFA